MWAFIIRATVEWQSWKTAQCGGEMSFDFSPHCYCKAKSDYADMYFSGWIEFNSLNLQWRKTNSKELRAHLWVCTVSCVWATQLKMLPDFFFFLISCHSIVEKQSKLIMTLKGSRHCLVLQLVLNFITWTLVGKIWNWMNPAEFILYVTVSGDYFPILIKKYFVTNCEQLFQNSLSCFHSSGKG